MLAWLIKQDEKLGIWSLKLGVSAFQADQFIRVDGLPRSIEGDDDGKTYSHFSSGYGDDEKDKHLAIVVG